VFYYISMLEQFKRTYSKKNQELIRTVKKNQYIQVFLMRLTIIALSCDNIRPFFAEIINGLYSHLFFSVFYSVIY
jgi:hypothetical protein